MTVDTHAAARTPGPGLDGVAYGLAQAENLDEAARIFVAQFPERVATWFSDASRAECFYRDLLELQWRANGASFLVASQGGALAGYLVLTMPGRSLLRAMTAPSFFLRAAQHALRGRYGMRVLGKVFAEMLGIDRTAVARQMSRYPCIYVVAVAQDHAGQGIGTALVKRAQEYCRGRASRLWLFVEKGNAGAIRLYQRLGFRALATEQHQILMACEIQPPAAQPGSDSAAMAERSRA